MCVGLPMTVVSSDDASAVVEGWGQRRVVGTLLVGDVAKGMVVLVHLSDAVRVLDAEEAEALRSSIEALGLASEHGAP